MTTPGTGTPISRTAARFWLARRFWPHARSWILGLLPCPDQVSRYRMRRTASHLVTLKTWPGVTASSNQAAQLAMLRLLWLQRQTRRAVRGRHREAAVMLARACVETLLLGLYCQREPKAVSQLDSANIKAFQDALRYLDYLDMVPADVIRQCAAKLGKPSTGPKVWRMAETIDTASGNTAARDIYSRLYVPLSHFTVHASGGMLLRHVRRGGKLRQRPSRTWNRRSPARVADATTGILAAALAHEAGQQGDWLGSYAKRHIDRALMPVAVMGLSGQGGVGRGRAMITKILRAAGRARDTNDYLWHGRAAADPPEVRTAYVRDQFAAILDTGGLDIPKGSLDPFIDYIAAKLARIPEDDRGPEPPPAPPGRPKADSEG